MPSEERGEPEPPQWVAEKSAGTSLTGGKITMTTADHLQRTRFLKHVNKLRSAGLAYDAENS
jgi:hypothetical protein